MVLASPHVLAQHDLAEHEPTREWASQIPPRVSTEHVRVLLVGERGGGKTTLWRNLLASYAGAQVCPPRPQHLPPTQPCVNLPDASLLSTAGLRSQRPACNFKSILQQHPASRHALKQAKASFCGHYPGRCFNKVPQPRAPCRPSGSSRRIWQLMWRCGSRRRARWFTPSRRLPGGVSP